MASILEELKKRILFFDGGTGTLLQARGLKPGELPETWNLIHPEEIVALHTGYLEAGCDILAANTFGANALKFPDSSPYPVDTIVSAAIKNAKTAVADYERAHGKRPYGPYVALDLGPTGKLLKPLGDLDFEDAYRLYAQVVDAGVREGADLILIETMSDCYEIKAALLAAKEHSTLPVFVTVTFDEDGKLLTGGTILSVVALLEGLGADAIGLNCGLGPAQMLSLAKTMLSLSSLPLIVNPNAGLPHAKDGLTVFDVGPEEFAGYAAQMADMGVRILGGCCGTTPEHIRQVVASCQGKKPLPLLPKELSVVSSYGQAVIIGEDPIIIGERINPTGKKKFQQALREKDLAYILREGFTQEEKGAHILDVNVGQPDIDEPSMMEEVVKELQSVLSLPLQIDTSDPKAMERGLRVYNGKALVNSVNGKEETMRQIFPLVKKYGGVVVALTLDESGIPATADGRIAVARKIYDTAASYGIAKKDILIDPLAMTISSDPQSAAVTLEALRRIRDELHGHTILGVSNISFGLPSRPVINGVFYAMALQNGLNAAIMNPSSEEMMRSYYAYRALMGIDSQCQDYIAAYSGQAQAPVQKASALTLKEAVIKGLKEEAREAAKKELKAREALSVIDEDLIPALTVVGDGFEKKTVFLPGLLMSAEAAKEAFEVIKDTLSASGKAQEKKGKIVIATVKGDIHDIGKNIVKVLLENYSYDVIDLGKDVPPETIVEAVVRDHVKLVGLSALMTTTVPSMEETIRQLRKKAPWCKVMVGGAVMTQEYADMIGADFYGADAMASVHYAEKIM